MAHRYPFSVIYPSDYYDQRVAAYYNLAYKVFSLKERSSHGLLLSHAGVCTLVNVVFDVDVKGRQRAHRLGKRTVHAYAIGFLKHLGWNLLTEAEIKSLFERGYQRVTYNLHHDYPEFYLKDCDRYIPVKTAESVVLTGKTALALI